MPVGIEPARTKVQFKQRISCNFYAEPMDGYTGYNPKTFKESRPTNENSDLEIEINPRYSRSGPDRIRVDGGVRRGRRRCDYAEYFAKHQHHLQPGRFRDDTGFGQLNLLSAKARRTVLVPGCPPL